MNSTAREDSLVVYTDAVLVFTVTCMVLGALGNGLVMYSFRFETSSFNTLVTFLSAVDLLACVLHMPLDIASFVDPYIVGYDSICKITCFMIAFTAVVSSLLLVTIACVRYRAVCKPHSDNLSVKQAVFTSLAALCCGVVLAWPSIPMFGVTRIFLNDNFYIFCGVQNDFMHDPNPVRYYSVLAVLFAIGFTALAILYIRVARELWSKRKIFADTNIRSQALSSISTIARNAKPREMKMTQFLTVPRRVIKVASNADVYLEVRSRRKTQKSFIMMFLVSLVFVLAFTPHLVIVFYFTTYKQISMPEVSLSGWYGVLLRSYYVNNVADPIIYGFFSQEFRRTVSNLPRRIKNTCFK